MIYKDKKTILIFIFYAIFPIWEIILSKVFIHPFSYSIKTLPMGYFYTMKFIVAAIEFLFIYFTIDLSKNKIEVKNIQRLRILLLVWLGIFLLLWTNYNIHIFTSLKFTIRLISEKDLYGVFGAYLCLLWYLTKIVRKNKEMP